MASQSRDPSNRSRNWATLFFGVYSGGFIFILWAVLVLFGGDVLLGRNETLLNLFIAFIAVVVGTAIGGVFTAVLRRRMAPAFPRSPAADKRVKWASRNPVLAALAVGVSILIVAFLFGMAFYWVYLPARLVFVASVTVALAAGAWSALMSYMSFRLASSGRISSDRIL